MRRADKGRAIARYLIGRVGIPTLRWDGTSSEVLSPPPYRFYVTTDAASWRFWKYIKDDPKAFVIRYDKFIDDIDHAVVGMTLETFALLLKDNYDNIQDRITTFVEGE